MNNYTQEAITRMKDYRGYQNIIKLLANEPGRENDYERAKAEVSAIDQALSKLAPEEFEIMWRVYIDHERGYVQRMAREKYCSIRTIQRMREKALLKVVDAMFNTPGK